MSLLVAVSASAATLDGQLISAARSGKTGSVRALIKRGANVNARDKDRATALMRAIVNGHEDTARLLIKSGADVNLKDNEGTTALMGAAFNGRTWTWIFGRS